MTNFPTLLKTGDSIGLITPSGFIKEEKLQKAVENIKSLGLKPVFSDSVLEKHGYLAGTDKSRLQELHAMYKDSNIKAIWCVRGGYGATRLLDKIDYKLIQNNPKPLIGYSDISALIQGIYKKTGIIGFHGMVAGGTFTPFTKQNIRKIFFETSETIKINICEKHLKDIYVFNKKNFSGKFSGGNLALTASICGTPYEDKQDKSIIFLEDVNEEPYKIDRMLTQLISSGKFKNAQGIILGRFKQCEASDKNNSLSLKELIADKINSLQLPCIYGFSFGHIKNQVIIPVGVHAFFDFKDLSISIERREINKFFI